MGGNSKEGDMHGKYGEKWAWVVTVKRVICMENMERNGHGW
jgi:hypothetical protein